MFRAEACCILCPPAVAGGVSDHRDEPVTNDLNRGTPSLSPVLLAGFALRPVPPAVLRPALDFAMSIMRRRHPDVFQRLETLADARFLIDPVDLPFRFTLRLGPPAPRLDPAGPAAAADSHTATLRGPLLVLIRLLEGRIDGDAAFFSRDLAVEGDIEAVLTLRNAVDSGGIDLAEDLLSLFGPLSGPARRVFGVAEALFARAERDLETVRSAFMAPVEGRCEAQTARLRDLEGDLADLRSRIRRPPAAGRRSAEPGEARP
jgi:predicted lipid carrier protein YhbT